MSSRNGHRPDRWAGIQRPYYVEHLRGSIEVEHTLARLGAERLWSFRHSESCVPALGAMTGGQAVQMVKAGLKSIYLSGWQVAVDANLNGHTYPDQNLYAATSAPALVRRLNNALLRADQIEHAEARNGTYWLAPIVADAEAGFGGPLNAFELMKAMIEAGAAGVHFEDRLAAEKKCGHLGGKVLVPTSQFLRTLAAARLAADVCDVQTILVARTDALSATLLTSDVDEADAEFCTGERTPEGFFRIRAGLESAIARALAYAPYADLIWFETSTPDLGEAREFAHAVHERFPGKLFAYNCSPSFNWRKHLSDAEIASFRETLAELGYRYQFVTLAGSSRGCSPRGSASGSPRRATRRSTSSSTRSKQLGSISTVSRRRLPATPSRFTRASTSELDRAAGVPGRAAHRRDSVAVRARGLRRRPRLPVHR